MGLPGGAGTAMAVGVALVVGAGQAQAAEVALRAVATGLTQPLALVSPPGDERRFIVEQGGRIRVLMPDGALADEPFLDLSDRMADLRPNFDERGFLGLAFHPGFADNGRFYIYYSAPLRDRADDPEWDHTAHLSEFRVSRAAPDRADPASERVVLQIDQPGDIHNGGALAFGPDGHLFLGLGDGGDDILQPDQRTDSLLGKILRLDVSGYPYRIPADNPFVADVHYRPEIFALGFRNPYRCTFDRGGAGELFCADAGHARYEEVNLVRAGGHYGWRIKEGPHCFDFEDPLGHPAACDDDGLIDPIVAYVNCSLDEDCHGRSVIGGHVYRGEAIPALAGSYVFGDWSAAPDGVGPPLFVASPTGTPEAPWAFSTLSLAEPLEAYVLGFGEDAAGELYVLASRAVGPDPARAEGTVYQIVPAGGPARGGEDDTVVGDPGSRPAVASGDDRG
jgi:glucose/arabinose dehydrogenase